MATKKKAAKRGKKAAAKQPATKKKASAKKATKKKASAKKASAKKATKKKASAKKAAAKRPATKKKAAAKQPATKKKASAKKAAAKRPATKKKASAKKASAKKATKKKAAPKRAAAPAQVAAAPAPAIGVGSRAPAFRLPDQNGQFVDSSELAGKPYVIYFYPRDNTPGCTREACEFRDARAEFDAEGVRVIGVSRDSEQSHAGFAEKYSLPFTLLSDTENALISAYGSWVEKQNYGRTYMGIQRSTFVVGADGVIKKAWRSVKVNGHVPQVLEQAKELS